MIKQAVFTFILGACLLAVGMAPVAAQQGPDAYSIVFLNMRAGPGPGYSVLTTLYPETGLILEARNADTSWVFGHTADGALSGWVFAIYLRYRDGFSPVNLPVDDTVTAQAVPAAAGQSALPASAVSPRAREIFMQGQAMGNDPHSFIKVGDCNSDSDVFLNAAFQYNQYDLGPYAHLQTTIDFFSSSFGRFSPSASPGFSILSVMDPMYREAQYCHDWISPLECDFHYFRPSVVFIMPMAGDVYGLTDYQYAAGLDQVVNFAIAHGAIPVLVTFPVSERENAINGTLRSTAAAYGVPLIDFAAAAAGLPDRGLVPGDTVHLSGGNFISFNGEQDRYGFTLLNLLALQMLDQLRAEMN